jgi:hypothetical protein
VFDSSGTIFGIFASAPIWVSVIRLLFFALSRSGEPRPSYACIIFYALGPFVVLAGVASFFLLHVFSGIWLIPFFFCSWFLFVVALSLDPKLQKSHR